MPQVGLCSSQIRWEEERQRLLRVAVPSAQQLDFVVVEPYCSGQGGCSVAKAVA